MVEETRVLTLKLDTEWGNCSNLMDILLYVMYNRQQKKTQKFVLYNTKYTSYDTKCAIHNTLILHMPYIL